MFTLYNAPLNSGLNFLLKLWLKIKTLWMWAMILYFFSPEQLKLLYQKHFTLIYAIILFKKNIKICLCTMCDVHFISSKQILFWVPFYKTGQQLWYKVLNLWNMTVYMCGNLSTILSLRFLLLTKLNAVIAYGVFRDVRVQILIWFQTSAPHKTQFSDF